MKIPPQSPWFGSKASSRCHLYFCSHVQSPIQRIVLDVLERQLCYKIEIYCTIILYFRNKRILTGSIWKELLPTNFLMHSLLELFIVYDGTHFSVTISCPVWGSDFDFGVTNVNSEELRLFACFE